MALVDGPGMKYMGDALAIRLTKLKVAQSMQILFTQLLISKLSRALDVLFIIGADLFAHSAQHHDFTLSICFSHGQTLDVH